LDITALCNVCTAVSEEEQVIYIMLRDYKDKQLYNKMQLPNKTIERALGKQIRPNSS